MEMTKPYDIGYLMSLFKARGLDVGEDLAKGILEDGFAFLTKSAQLSATPFDDMLATAYPLVKKQALELADKIDGKVG